MNAIVLLNPSAGSLFVRKAAHDVERVGLAFAAAGLAAEVELIRGEDLEPVARRAARRHVDMVVVGGGDGSVGAAAAALADTGTPLGILPFGTLNHFARDVGVPFHLDEAVAVLAAGHVLSVDVAEVNGLVFVNNSMVGAYPLLVEERETHRRHRHTGKLRAGAHAFASVTRRLPSVTMQISTGDTSTRFDTSLLVIGNNRYATGVLGFGRRAALDGGLLSVYATHGRRRRHAALSLARLVTGRPEAANLLQAAAVPAITVTVADPSVKVSADGEVRHLRSPLHYRIRPRALRVVAPPPPPGT